MNTATSIRQIGRAAPGLLILIAAAFAAAGAFTAGRWLQPPEVQLQAAKVYPQPRPLSEFTLTAADGDAFDRSHWSGDWDLVFFGFTHCHHVCPSTLNDLKAITATMSSNGQKPPRVTFISVDPERDTPTRLKSYTRQFSRDFQSATGTHEQLQALSRQMGVAYQIAPHTEGASAYQVDHSAALLLVDPQARLTALFPAPHQVDKIIPDLAALTGG